jgi:hypothetical protein
MNPGPQLGWLAVAVTYTIVFAAIFIFLGLMSKRRRRLEKRARELKP